MAQSRFERVLFHLAGEVIAASTKISRAENCAGSDFPLEAEIVLQCVWELRMVCRRQDVQRLREGSILRVQEVGKHKRFEFEKRRQKPVDTKQQHGELVAKDAGSAPQHSLAVAKNAPRKAGLRG